jgi:putative hydroxymethylpyrimidine transport system substrate-binding protein
VPTYDELVLVAQGDQLSENSEAIRLFIAALARGTAAAAADPQLATQAVLDANEGLDPKVTAAEVKATLPLLEPSDQDRPFGYMDPADWEEFVGWMRDNDLIDSLPPTSDLLTNDYLPGNVPD